MNADSDKRDREYSYLSTIIREFKLTKNQVQSAGSDGLVEMREVENPHNSEMVATIVKRKDVEAHLTQIKSYPTLAPNERTDRKRYAGRRRLRDKLEFHCPRCERDIRALRGSEMFEVCWERQASTEEAQRVLMVAHYRHEHTDYEKRLRERADLRYERYREFRDGGYDFDEAWERIDEEDIEEEDEGEEFDIKARSNEEALSLLHQDFPTVFAHQRSKYERQESNT